MYTAGAPVNARGAAAKEMTPEMLAYAARRLAAIPPTLFVIVTLAFAVVRAAPGGPFDAEQSLPPQVKANLERAYGLDQPLATQYLRYLSAIAHGDFRPLPEVSRPQRREH